MVESRSVALSLCGDDTGTPLCFYGTPINSLLFHVLVGIAEFVGPLSVVLVGGRQEST